MTCAAGEGRRLRGDGWVGGWIYSGDETRAPSGKTPEPDAKSHGSKSKSPQPDEDLPDLDALTALIDHTYSAVAERVCSDWDARPPRRKPPVLAGRFESVAELLRRIDIEKTDEIERRASGMFWRGVVIATGDPESDDFQHTLAHEMCHALCDTVFGVDHTIPWASEGYAEYVAQVTAWNAEAWYAQTAAQTASMECVVGTRVPELLVADYDDEKHPLYYEVAAMFVYYLKELSRVEPRAWVFLREALTTHPDNHPPDLLSLKISTGFTLEELERGFQAFCAKEAERFNLRPFRWCDHPPRDSHSTN